MNKSLIMGSLLSASLLLLSSCASFHRTVARVHSSMVGETPYADPAAKKPTAPVPPQQTLSYKQRLAQWSPTLSSPPKPLPGYTPFPDQNYTDKVAGSVKVNPRYTSPKSTAKSKPAPKATKKPQARPARVTQATAKPKRKPARIAKSNPPKKVKKATAKPNSTPAKDRVYTVRYVPGKPTHVQHPHDRKTIIRITDKEGNKPAKGTIMRVPGENVRFYVP